jgi:hypothetical protein
MKVGRDRLKGMSANDRISTEKFGLEQDASRVHPEGIQHSRGRLGVRRWAMRTEKRERMDP